MHLFALKFLKWIVIGPWGLKPPGKGVGCLCPLAEANGNKDLCIRLVVLWREIRRISDNCRQLQLTVPGASPSVVGDFSPLKVHVAEALLEDASLFMYTSNFYITFGMIFIINSY